MTDVDPVPFFFCHRETKRSFLFKCLRVRERVNASRGNDKGTNDVSLVFFPDDQTRIRVVEEFVESVTHHRSRASRSLGRGLAPFT